MELRPIFSDNSDHLSHHGVLGMKWGKWNSETIRKRMGSGAAKARKAGANAIKATGRVATTGAKVVAGKAAEKYRERREAKALAKSAGATHGKQLKEFKKLRKETLQSHDPEQIEKGMHTLTDSELNNKITRMNKEKQVRDLASNKRNTALDTQKKTYEVDKARKEAKNSSMRSKLIATTYNSTVNYAGKKAVDMAFDKASKGLFQKATRLVPGKTYKMTKKKTS